MNEKIQTHWAIHLEFMILLLTLLGSFYLLDGKIERAIESSDRKLEFQSMRSDKLTERTDRLYEMFIDLVRERDSKSHAKFE